MSVTGPQTRDWQSWGVANRSATGSLPTSWSKDFLVHVGLRGLARVDRADVALGVGDRVGLDLRRLLADRGDRVLGRLDTSIAPVLAICLPPVE